MKSSNGQYKIGIIGHFMYNQSEGAVNGQSVKTYNVYEMLCKRYGDSQVMTMDTNYFRKKLIRNYGKVFEICRNVDVVFILPTGNGLKLLLPILYILKRIYKFKIFYPVIGGWLPEYLSQNAWIRKYFKCIDRVYPETDDMKKAIQQLGISNVETMYNFSMRKVVQISEDEKEIEIPYKMCTFSRVTKSKGIGEAIEAVALINKRYNDKRCVLHVYGPIDEVYKGEFELLVKKNEVCVSYCGVLEGDNIIKTLSKYAIMLFPTYYLGEGMPGAVLEAFAAGVPVIASNWHNNAEVVRHGYTGLIYELGNNENLVNSIEELIHDVEVLKRMRDNCLLESKKYAPETIMQPIFEAIED